MYQVSDLFPLIIIALFGWYWWSAQGVKEIALKAAKLHCREMGVQLLDESVALHRLWFKKDPNNKTRTWRSYLFEFTSTGEERYQGRVILLGKIVEQVQLQAHRFNE